MFSSFTKDEQKLIISVLAIACLGFGALQLRKMHVPLLHYAEAAAPETTSGTQNLASGNGMRNATLGAHLLQDGRLDLNAATEAELEALPGVGPSTAKSILEYRKESGRFHTYTDLDNVPRIGPSMMKKLAPVAGVIETSAPAVPAAPLQPTQPAAYNLPEQGMAAAGPLSFSTAAVERAPAPASIININTATLPQLESLNRIGPALAQRIIDYRSTHGGFRTVEELSAVKGIGPKTMDLNRSRLTIR